MVEENNQNKELRIRKKAVVTPIISYKPGKSDKPIKPDNKPTSKPKK